MFVLKGDSNGYEWKQLDDKEEYEAHVSAHEVKYFKFTKFPRQGSRMARLLAISPKQKLSEYDVAVGVNRHGRMVQFCMVTDNVDGTYFHSVNPSIDANNRRYTAPYHELYKRFAQLFKRVLKKATRAGVSAA
jgi:hypothetical protein